MSGEGDSGDSSSDYSEKPSTSANSRRITRSSRNASASASCSSLTRGAVGVSSGSGSKKKRRIVMRIEFDDDSDESSSTSDSSGISDDATNNKKTNNSIKTGNNHDDKIKPASSSKRVRGKLGKKSNFVFNSDDDSDSSKDGVPVGGIRCRNGRSRQILEDDNDAEEEGGSSNGREISGKLQNVKKATMSQEEIPTLSTSHQRDEENGFNSDSSSNELLEKCPICLLTFRAQEIGSPATCQHIFCANCIEAWSKNVQTCPIDRIEFDRIVVRESFENRAVVREIKVSKADCVEKMNHSDDDVTHCEVCNRPDREDVMLLCDSCNQGYHIDCLTPALAEIPEGSWYCDNCFDSENEDSDMVDDLNELYADIRDMGIPETRLRVTEVHQPRILRTRQNERIRAAIISRTRSTARNQNVDVAPSTSRAASTSSRSTRTVRNSSRTTARVPKTRRRRRRRARKRTYVVEYDLNNYDEKFAIKTTKRVIRRRRRKRTRKTALSKRQAELLYGGKQTASKRLAEQLGVKSSNREARAAASSQSFSLFGSANDLEYFSESDGGGTENQIEISTGGGGPTAVQTSIRVSSFRTHRGKKGLLNRLEREPPTSTPDLLSNIMDLQDRWHNASRHMDAVRIGQDGSLNLPPPSTSSGPSNLSVPAVPAATTTQPSNIEVTQAPMYPRGGGGNNRNFNTGGGGGGGNSGGGNYNNRYNNQSNYRGGSSGGGGGGGGGSYRSSFGSGGGNSGNVMAGAGNLFNMVGRGNFSFSSQNLNNDNNSNNNNSNNNNNPNNRDRFNQRNNNNRNNQRNSLPLFNNQTNDNLITINQSPLQQHRQQNRPIMSVQSSQNNIQPLVTQYSNSQPQNLGLGTNAPLQQPPPFTCTLPPPPQPIFGPHNQSLPPMLTQPPPMLPMLQPQPLIAPVIPPLMGNPIAAPPLPAPPTFNSSLFQLTADYDNDEDDDSNCPNFSVYSMESLQVAKSDVRPAAESKGETPKEDDENEDLVQLSDDDEATGTNKDDESEIPLPPPIDKESEQRNSPELYEPDQPTFESDDENEFDAAPKNTENNASNEDEQNKDHSNNDIESQPSPENDMEIESQDSATEKKVSSEPSQIDENEEPEGDKCSEDVTSLSEVIIPKGESKNKRSTPRKGVLELYDDSDWEELNMERPNVDDYQIRTPPLEQNLSEINEDPVEDKDDEEENMTPPTQPRPTSSLAEGLAVNGDEKVDEEKKEDDEDREQDRSYTPCLDENNEEENDGACTPELVGPSTGDLNPEEASHTPEHAVATADAAGIAGMETELISEDDDSDKRDKNKRSKGTKDKEQFKKVSKNQKDRNYRTEKALNGGRRKSRSRRRRSRSRTNDKENNGIYRRGAQRGGRFKRREIPRYNVRNVVNHQRSFKDRYGRDTSRPARSTSRTRRRRSFSKSVSRSKSNSGPSPTKRVRRSFSMSPTPPRHPIQRRQSMSPRRRSRSPIRRSPIRRNSRSPLRMRSRSNTPLRRNKHKPKKVKRSLTPVNRTRSLSRFTPRLSRSRTPPRHKIVKRPKDRNKKKKKKRQASPSPQELSPWGRVPSRHRDSMPPSKRKRHHTPKGKSPVVDQGWSPSPSPPRTYMHENVSWTPPLTSPAGPTRLHRNEQYNEFPITSKPPKEKKKREKKKKKGEKRRQENSRNKEKRRREPGVLSQAAPSKEVFASGSNILVSVSFNKDGTQPQQHTVVTLPPTREEVLAGIRGRSKDRQTDQQGKKKRRKDGRKRKKNDTKPIAIIDLERSPFQVTQEPTDVIVLTDSDNGQDDDENLNISRESGNVMMAEMDHHEGSSHRTANIDKTPPLDRLQTIMEESYENAILQQGPKTPPEPQGGIKFNLINKNKQKQIRNVLHDTGELESDEHHEEERTEDRDPMQQSANKIGPNTPPESGPCSPDVYDPFDPTKSPSMSPRSPTPPLDVSQHESAPDNDKHSTEDLRSETRMTASSGGPVAPEKNTLNPVDLVMALMNTKTNSSQDLANKSNETQYSSNQVVNLLDDNEKPEENSSNLGITILSNVIYSTGKNQHIPVISSPPLSKSSSNKPPQKVANILSNLPGLGNRHNGDGDVFNEIESPYSPGSADYEDLFEPPPDTNGGTKRRRGERRGGKKEGAGDVFENLFGTSPHQFVRSSNARKHKAALASARNKHKMIVKVQKLPGNNNDDHVKVYDDLPNSAVELQVKDKFLRKLNRQERVVEEVKMILKPRFNKKQITKDDYKEIMRRAVPKICHSKSGEINPKKIQNLIEAYVKKFRQKHRKLNIPNTGQVSSAVKCAAYLKKL